MKNLYIILTIISLGYVVFKHRKIDFFTIYIFSILLYYFPAYLGIIYDGKDKDIIIYNRTYVVLCINLFIVLCVILLKDYRKELKNNINIIDRKCYFYYNKAVLIIAFMTTGLICLSIIHYGGGKGTTFNKMQLLASANKVTEYTKYFATFVFVYGFTNSGKSIKIIRLIGIISILYTFILGHRSFLVISVICILYQYVTKEIKYVSAYKLIRQHQKFAFGVVIFTLLIFFIKNVFAALMDGNYDLVIARLVDKDYYFNALLQSEPNSIVKNLNNVIQYNMKYEVLSYFMIIVLGLMPYIGDKLLNFYNLRSFEYMLQLNFNDQIDEGIGLGSTFLGEAYSTGGYIFLIVICTIVCLSICLLEKELYKKKTSPIVRTWVMIFLVYLTFYISRNSLVYVLVTARAYLYILVLAWLIKQVTVKFYMSFGKKGIQHSYIIKISK